MNELKLFAILVIALVFTACASSITPTTQPATPPTTSAPGNSTPVSVTITAPTTQPPRATATQVPPTPTPAPIGGLKSETSAEWDNLVVSIEAEEPQRAQERVNTFWNAVVNAGRVPLILEDAAIFLYRGSASTVTWRGDFSYWQLGTGLEGKRISNTDLWYSVANFPRDSRTEYKIFLDNSRWILDPENPNTRRGGLGDNSVLTMPRFKVTDFTKPRADVKPGILTDWITFESGTMGPVNYRIYHPPNADTADNFPVLYVTDGNDFSDERMGAMQIVLDNLIAAGRIRTMMVVFIDARNPKNPDDNQRETQFLAQHEKFAEFIATELVGYIDARYRTDRSPEGRALVGVSYGGVFTTYAGLRYPDIFAKLAIYSPAYWVFETPAGTGDEAYAAGARRMSAFVEEALSKPAAEPQKIFMSGGIPNWDVGDLEPMAKRFSERGATIQVLKVQEGHSWGAWSGLTDEMMEYLFGE